MRWPRWRTTSSIGGGFVLALIGLVLSLAACSREAARSNLLLISVDTLRADHLGHAGYPRNTSHGMDELAANGVYFERSYSQSGWTLPSVASLLTGRYPSQHGVSQIHRSLPEDVPTLAGILREHGYQTKGFISHVLLKSKFGLDRGFDLYDESALDIGHPHRVATAAPLTDQVVANLDDIREPFLIWVHYFDPHFHYLKHSRWENFGDTDLDRYDQEIAHTDEQIDRLLAQVEERGLAERTVIALTADHGEEFRDHGGIFHSTLYEEVLRVPLIIAAPGLEPAVRSDPTDQVDLLPTLLGLLGIEPPADLPGRDLLDTERGSRPIFVERDRPTRFRQRGIIVGDWKLMTVEEKSSETEDIAARRLQSRRTRVDPGRYLFNLASDPGETRNLFDPENDQTSALLDMMDRHFSSPERQGGEVEIDEALREELRSLGYLE